MKKSQILFCILNYKHSENAIKWAESLKNDFAVSILDTYVLDNPDSDDALKDYKGNVLFFHNIYLGGITLEAFKICVGGGFKFLVIITSDVEIDEENLEQLKKHFENLPDNIGIYETSTTMNSCVMGVVGPIPYTERYFSHSNKDFKENGLAEGWLYGINVECVKKIIPHIFPEKHKHGWGIGGALLNISKSLGYRNVIDSKVFIYHPKGTAYNALDAKHEWYAFDRTSEKIGISDAFITLGFCTKEHNKDYIKYIESCFSNACPIIEKVCNTDNKEEMLKAYNEIINESVTNGILLIQENARFASRENYTDLFQKIFFENKQYGIIGCAAKYALDDDIVKRNNGAVFGFNEVEENNRIFRYESNRGEMFSKEVFEDAVLDGRFLAIRKDRIKQYFNTAELELPYDAEFCISNYLEGVKIGVTKALWLTYTKKNAIIQSETERLKEKYKDILPIKI